MGYYTAFREFSPFDDRQEDQGATCKRCGKGGLHWTDDGDGRYVLMETEYRIHKCDERLVHAQTADDFEAL